ncbi:MAG: hypothetical protein IIB42_04420, partial [Candidatus Marinimicrobia bacterium]|nr:hypothetical protein [Candidatus Neomarinimicrobiota bacterium]
AIVDAAATAGQLEIGDVTDAVFGGGATQNINPNTQADPINFSVTDIEGNDYTNVKGLGFSWSGWIKPSNQASITGHIYFGGQFWSSNPKRHGKLTGIAGV